jgi:hypothetical protein
MNPVIGLDDIEALAEQLVEGTFGRLFRPPLHPSELVRRLARAMEDHQGCDEAGRLSLPNRYRVFLSPADYAALGSDHQALCRQLSGCLQQLAAQERGRLSGSLTITLQAKANLGAGQVEVRARHVVEPAGRRDTRQVAALTSTAAGASGWTLHCGERVFHLGEPVVRLGRALSNDVILDDARVSRRHAQLRWRQGSYYLSDLGSTYGVAVNGLPLRPGDEVSVADGDQISLAGLVLTASRQVEQLGR